MLLKEVLSKNDNDFQRLFDINITPLNETAPSQKKYAGANQMSF